MSRTVPDQVAAVLIAADDLGAAERSQADSTATGGGAIPGAPLNDDNSAMEISAGGYAWLPETLALSAFQGGGTTPGPTAARMTWAGQAGGSGSTPRGWMPATIACGWWKLSSPATGSSLTGVEKPDGLKLRNGKIVVAFTYDNAGDQAIRIGVYDPEVGGYKPPVGRYDSGGAAYVWSTASAWTWVDAVSEADIDTPPLTPALMELPDGTVMLFFSSLRSYRGGTQFYAVGAARSQDGGATWTTQSLDTGARIPQATGVPYKISAVYALGYTTLILAHDAGGGSSSFYHWYSADLGCSWTLVESDPVGTVEWSPGLVACDDGSVLAFWLQASGGAATLKAARKVVSSGSFGGAEFTVEQWTAQAFAPGEDRLAVCMGDDHTIQIAAIVYASGGRSERLRYLRALQTIASGAEIVEVPPPGDDLEAEPLDYDDGAAGAQHPYARAILPWGEGLWVLSELPGGSPDAVVVQLARYGSIDWNGPTFGLYQDGATVRRYGVWWDASYLPSTVAAWTMAGGGAEGSSAERALSLNYSGGAAFRYAERTGTAGSGVVAMVRVRVDSGGSVAADDIGVRVRAADGVADYDVSVRLSTTAIRAYDNNGAAAIDTVTGLTASQTLDLLISLTGSGRFTVWYREATSQVWLQGPTGNPTNNSATPAATPLIRWGALTASTGKSTWFFVGSSLDEWPAWPATVTEPNQPRIEFGREISIWPQYVADGRTVAAQSAPALTGEGWTLPPAWRYPVEALDPAQNPSPSVVWRSDDDQQIQILQWNLAAETVLPSPLVGAYLRAPNFLSAALQYYDGAAWTDIGVLSTVAASGLFTRTGLRVLPDSAPTGLPVGRDEWAGSWVVLSSGGSHHYRRIAGNTPGYWRNSADALQAVILLDSDSDLTGLPASGTIQIIAPEVAVVADLGDTPADQIRLRIPARTHASADQDYHTAALLIVGPVIAFGQPPAWASTRGLTPVQDVTETANGRRRVRTLAPRGRRDISVAWTDPVLDLELDDGSREMIAPAASGPGAAFAHDSRAVEDLLFATDAARRLCVYLPSVTMPGETITGRDRLLCGRVIGATRRTEVIYRPGEHTLATISEITFSEEL